jgi:hypothetical protein
MPVPSMRSDCIPVFRLRKASLVNLGPVRAVHLGIARDCGEILRAPFSQYAHLAPRGFESALHPDQSPRWNASC